MKDDSSQNQFNQNINNPSEKEGLFDGRLLKDRMRRFLTRVNEGLKEAQDHLPDFEIESIQVNTVIGANGEFTFPMMGGSINYSRAITFNLKPRNKE